MVFESKKYKILKEVLQVILSIDKNILEKTKKTCSLYKPLSNKNISLGLILEKTGIIRKYDFSSHESPFEADQIIEDYYREYGNNIYNDIYRLLFSFDNYTTYIYQKLSNIEDELILLLKKNNSAYSKEELYYIRLNFMDTIFYSIVKKTRPVLIKSQFPFKDKELFRIFSNIIEKHFPLELEECNRCGYKGEFDINGSETFCPECGWEKSYADSLTKKQKRKIKRVRKRYPHYYED